MKNKSLSKNLVYQRKLRGYSQEELAEMTTVTVRTIQRIEKGEVNPHLQTVKLLAAALEIEVDDLLNLENPKEEAIQKKWLLLLHGTPLLGFVLPLFNILIPLFIWIHKREDNPLYDRHGRAVVNFQITMTILFVLSFITLVTIEGFGFFFFISVIPFIILVILANIIAMLNTQKCYYPLAIPFLGSKKPGVSKTPGVLVFLGVLGLAGCESLLSQPLTRSDTDIAALVQRLDSLRETSNIPGLSIAVVKDQAIVLAAGLGYADFEAGIPATAETAYDIASVAKPLSAVVALRLVETGVLDLDRPIADYSEWADFCTGFSQQPSILARELRCEPPVHTLRHLLSHTATGTPGTLFSYNPVLYSWASRPIMASADASFSALVEQYVFKPAGMRKSARKHRDLQLPEDLARRLAPPQRIDSSGAILHAPTGSPQGDGAAGGVVSTVLDLAKFDITLDQDVLISAESRAEMMTPTRTVDGEALPYGLGWYVQEYEGHTLVWHSGWWEDAYSALYLKIPTLNLSFIILANSEGIWWGNPPERAAVERSQFAQAFLSAFVDP